jgi:hypothetical protein
VAQALALRVREMPAAMADYKGLTAIRAPLLDYLERRAAGASPPVTLSAS